jgi:TRAP-type mannitol/chloroaromatic compound transport system substrate-binding protein
MKRREFLKRAGLGGAAGATAGAATLAAPARAASGNMHWRMATSGVGNDAPFFDAAERIARRVAELTEGRFRIRVSAAGEIADGARLLDAVRSGEAESGLVSLRALAGREPAFALAAGVPFGLDPRHRSAWMTSGGGREALEPLFAEYGVVRLPAGSTGAQIGTWSRKEIRGVDDLEGMRLATGGLAGRVYARLGAEPQALAGSEVLAALEQGRIDAVEWLSPYDDERRGLAKAARYYYYPGLWEAGPELSLIADRGNWDGLPKAYQAALESACSDAAAHIGARYDAENPQALRRLLAEGVELRSLPQPVLEAAEAAANRLYAELGPVNPRWMRVYPQWAAFRDLHHPWARLAQYGLDSFAYTRTAKT